MSRSPTNKAMNSFWMPMEKAAKPRTKAKAKTKLKTRAKNEAAPKARRKAS